VTENIGIGIVNPSAANKFSMETFKVLFFKKIPGTNIILYLFRDLIQSTHPHHISYIVVSDPVREVLTRNTLYKNELAAVRESGLDFSNMKDFSGRPESEILQLSITNNPNLRFDLSDETQKEICRENNPFWSEFLEEAMNTKKSYEVIDG
jgi:hypothetical protein